MMKFSKFLLVIPCIFLFSSVHAQNCGYVDAFRKTVVDNGNGTSTYNFEIDVRTTSGGGKSVKFRLDCNSYLFESNECIATGTSLITYSYGPYTLAHSVCNISPSIIWTGHTNSTCGGATCIGETITLPVTMVNFDSKRMGNEVVLDWSTASEINNKGFEVYHSTDGAVWEVIGWVDGNGDSYELNNYQFTHENASDESHFYQLKQIDFDGKFEFTTITKVSSTDADEISTIKAFPNPFNNELTLTGEFESVRMFSVSGSEVDVTRNGNTIDTGDLVPGVYFIEATTEKGVQTLRVVK